MAGPPQPTPAPLLEHLLHHPSPAFVRGNPRGWVALQGAASTPGTSNPPCPPLAPGCASPCPLPSLGPAESPAGFLFSFFLVPNN